MSMFYKCICKKCEKEFLNNWSSKDICEECYKKGNPNGDEIYTLDEISSIIILGKSNNIIEILKWKWHSILI